MTRTARTILVICIALATASVSTFFVYRAIANRGVREVGVPGIKVVAAAQDLPAGHPIARQDLKLIDWPAGSQVAGSATDIDKIVGRTLNTPVAVNDIVTESKLSSGQGAGFSSTIPAGMRGVSVRVDDVISVAGFVVPGTHVDLLVTMRPRAGAAVQETVTRTILSNVRVLASGTRDQQDKKDVKVANVVTLVVTPEDSQKIAHAASEGKITLALRNPADDAPTDPGGVGMSALLRGAEPLPVEKPAPPRKPAPRVVEKLDPTPPPVTVAQLPHEAPPNKVQAIRGVKSTEQEVP
jgi:pilus assembly protein CpaB